MANLISYADGNFTGATTFKGVEAGSAAVQATISASTNTTTSYVNSSAFTCTNADVLEGVLMHCKRVNTTGTVTIGLSADNGSTYAKEVTVNANNLPANPSWVFFSFGASPLTADGGSDYKVAIKSNSAGNATFYRDGTAGNWARLLRLDAAAAPAAGDVTYIVGQWTAADTGSSYAVTMDSTAATDYGAVNIGQNGTLAYGTSASTAYVLKLSGDLTVWDSGAFNMGTTGTAIPSTSSAELLMDCGSNVQYGIILKAGSSCQLQGASMTYTWALLASDEVANSTELTTNVSTGWADNDVIWIASTTRTYNQCEGGALNGAASGTTLTVDGFAGAGGGLAYAHSGTAPCQAEIINLTRNVKVHGAANNLQTYIDIQASASIDADWAEFYWMGSATAGKGGISMTGAAVGFSFYGCTTHNFEVAGSSFFSLGAVAPASSNIENCVGAYTASIHIYMGDFDFSSLTIQDCVFMYNTLNDSANANSFHVATAALGSYNPTISRVRVAGVRGSGFYFTGSHNQNVYTLLTDCVSHSNTYIGFRFTGMKYLSLSGCSSWRNSAKAALLAGSGLYSKVLLTSCSFLGNGAGVYVEDGLFIDMRDCEISPQSGYTSATGIVLSASNSAGVPGAGEIYLYNCKFGEYEKHTTQSISQGSGSGAGAWFNGWKLYLNNCKSFDDAYIDSLADQSVRASYSHTNYNQTSGDHRTYRMNCVNQTDAVIYKTAAPSERITPATTLIKSESGKKLAIVASGATKTISVWVRKSAAADAGGADYNGAEPRLVLRRNDALGITSDTVLDTMTAAVGNWEQLTGTTAAASQDGVFECFVDLDGTAGWVNVDDWSVA